MAAPRLLTYGRQCIDDDDKRAVLEVLGGDWLTQGPAVERFELALAAAMGAAHVSVVANGTAALHIAAIALGWQPGDVVIVPAVTFLASANCAAYVGAEPYFVDIDPRTLTIDLNDAERHIRRLREEGRRVRAIVAVDLAGHPADWPALRALADRYELQLLDDACHAMGAAYHGVPVGAVRHADVAVLSFHPVKHITTGEGGAVLTNDAALAERMARLRTHGMVRGAEKVRDWEGPWHYDMVELGYNYRLTDLQCALGLSQLAKLDRFLAARQRIAGWYQELLADSPLFRMQHAEPWAEHAYHLQVVRAPFGSDPAGKRRFFERCRDRGLLLQVHYRPVPMNSYYARPGLMDRMPAARQYYQEALSIPMYPQVTREDAELVVQILAASAEGGLDA